MVKPGDPNSDWSDRELVAAAEQGLHGSGALVESMSRLRTSNDTYSRRMFWLTVVLLLLTIVQVLPVVKGWFSPAVDMLNL
jgi:hypothetical protein